MECYARHLRLLVQNHRQYMYDEPGFTRAIVLILGEAPSRIRRFCPPRAVLLSTSVAVRHLVHIDLLCVDTRLVASCPPSSPRAHLISIACFLMNRNEPVMSKNASEKSTTESEGEATASEDIEADLVNKIQNAREALASSSPGHPDRAERAALLGYHLYWLYVHTGNISLINEAIEVERKALALRPPGHPHRANSCTNLGSFLHVRYKKTGGLALLDEAIELHREALVLRPPGHPNRANSCAILGSSLRVRCEQTSDVVLLDEAIKLHHEALALRPPGHPDRANSCFSLGSLLHVYYEQTGNLALLDEAIELKRETLALQPPGHPDRANSYANLGSSLYVRYEQAGDVALLNEAIKLTREALALQPPGHPDWALSCANLGCYLHVHYEQTGNLALLDEAIELKREALALRPPGHPDRALSCANLGPSLRLRYEQTGSVVLLDEAIKLEREALTLWPPVHPNRANSCAILGSSLRVRFEQTGDVVLLDEAIELQREALALQPPGHPHRALNCTNLGSSLEMRYHKTGDIALLDEAIELERKGLALRPLGHPDQATSCANLGSLLRVRYKQTGDVAQLNEAIENCIYASEYSSACRAWHLLTQLSQLHLFGNSPHYSVLKALEHLQQSFQHEADDTHHFISKACYITTLIWDNSGVWTPHITALLVDVYAKIVDRLPLVAGFVLDTSSRLRSLRSSGRIGSDACVAALLAQQPATALTLIDRAHGVVWSQALRQRDPQMEGAPASLSTELEGLLSAIATRPPVDPAGLPDQRHDQDLRYRQNTRIQTILRQIRAMPGLSHFMLGNTYETLREVARKHPVVVLVAARGRAFALIMSSAEESEPHALGLTLTSDDLQSLRGSAEQAGLRSRADTRDGNTDERLGIHTSGKTQSAI
jgi:tetratricopeptide (TPR) repeat protein